MFRVEEFLIPSCLLRADPDTRRRARLLLGFTLALLFWAPVFALIYAALGTPALAIAVLMAGVAVMLVPALLFWTNSVVWPGNWLTLSLFLVLVYVGYHTGGVRSPAASWFAAVPMLGTLLLGYRAGGAWLLASVTALVALAGVDDSTAKMLADISPDLFRLLLLSALFGITIVIFSLTLIYERLKDQALAALLATDRAKSEFLANMSHELRTPLTAILGYTELLTERYGASGSSDDLRAHLDTIRRNGEHLLEIISDILDLTKIEAERMIAESKVVSPVSLIDEVLSLMQVRADSKGIDLSVDYDPETPAWLYTDPKRLRQILFNLIGNAIKFTSAGSVHLEVRATPQSARACRLEIDVIDTGIGISPEHLPVLFEPFSQEDATSSRSFGGTGLGLAISRRLARMLGGEILVESALGRGSRFRVEIVAGIAAPDCERSLRQIHGSDQSSKMETNASAELRTHRKNDTVLPAEQTDAPLLGIRVLVAEDGPDNRLLIEHILQSVGADVVSVENGVAAVELARREDQRGFPFDVILMDMQMPLLDGYAATRALRRDGYSHPIVALTAHAMDEDMRKCLDAGCDDYAMKPIRRKMLLNLLENLINSSVAS